MEKMPGAGGGSFVRSLDHETFGADLLHDIENLLTAGSVGFRLDTRFHTLISDASRNRVVAALVTALHEVTEPVHHLHLDAEVGDSHVRQGQARRRHRRVS